MLRELFNSRVDRVLVVALGGGGDVVTAAVLAGALQDHGVDAVVASIAWERVAVDPAPGPVPLECFELTHKVGVHAALALPGCKAMREGRVFTPSVCAVASVLGEPVVVLDIRHGEVGLRRGLDEACQYISCDAVVGVDVGGDVMAQGHEEGLWSPLADSIGLAALANCRAEIKLLAVHSPGADGELDVEAVMRRLSEVAAHGGYVWARGLSRKDVALLELLVRSTSTEASRVALLASRGYYGQLAIRGGTRKLQVNLGSTVTYFLDARKAYELSPLARKVEGSTSLEEARRRLNEVGVYTELDFEEDYSLYSKLKELSAEDILALRALRLRQLRGESP